MLKVIFTDTKFFGFLMSKQRRSDTHHHKDVLELIQGCVRVDVDGSCNNIGEATHNRVIRDYLCNWIYGFQQKLEYLTSTVAEIQDIQRVQ